MFHYLSVQGTHHPVYSYDICITLSLVEVLLGICTDCFILLANLSMLRVLRMPSGNMGKASWALPGIHSEHLAWWIWFTSCCMSSSEFWFECWPLGLLTADLIKSFNYIIMPNATANMINGCPPLPTACMSISFEHPSYGVLCPKPVAICACPAQSVGKPIPSEFVCCPWCLKNFSVRLFQVDHMPT